MGDIDSWFVVDLPFLPAIELEECRSENEQKAPS